MVFLLFYKYVFLEYLKTEIENYKWIDSTLVRWIPLSLQDFALDFLLCSNSFTVNKSDKWIIISKNAGLKILKVGYFQLQKSKIQDGTNIGVNEWKWT